MWKVTVGYPLNFYGNAWCTNILCCDSTETSYILFIFLASNEKQVYFDVSTPFHVILHYQYYVLKYN
jgi:hypothetical protein